MKKRIRMPAVLLLISLVLAVPGRAQEEEREPLRFGGAMPELQGIEWLKGSDPMAVPEAERARLVVYDCWATWCGPCIQSIPHLNELVKTHGGTVAVVGLAVWDELDNVKRFIEKRGDDLSYAIGFDALGEASDKLMGAAGQDGIPCAFVVDAGTGRVLWFGHPMTMDDVLERILDGRYDPEAERAGMEAENAVQELMAQGNWDEAQRLVNEWKPQNPDKAAVLSMWIQVQKNDPAGVRQALDDILAGEIQAEEAMNLMGLMVLAVDRFPNETALQEAAISGAARMAAADPDDVMLQGMYWYALNSAKREVEAGLAADRLLELAWNEPEVLADLADSMMMEEVGTNFYPQAERAVARIRELKPDAPFGMAAFKLAALQGQDEQVQALAEQLLNQEDADSEVINTAAWELLTNERIEKNYHALAKSLAEKAETITMGENPAILDTLALAEFKMGNIARAIEMEKTAIQLAPQYEFLQTQLAMFEEALANESSVLTDDESPIQPDADAEESPVEEPDEASPSDVQAENEQEADMGSEQ